MFNVYESLRHVIHLFGRSFIEHAADWSQVFIGVIALGLTVRYSRKTLENVRKDRMSDQRPFLLLNYVDEKIYLVNHTEKGSHYESTSVLPTKDSEGTLDLDIPVSYSSLKNYGNGPAINIKINWRVKLIDIRNLEEPGHVIRIDLKDETPPNLHRYSVFSNSSYPVQPHLSSGEETQLYNLPRFIQQNTNFHVMAALCEVIIMCSDVFGNKCTTRQEVSVKMMPDGFYGDGKPIPFNMMIGNFIERQYSYEELGR